MPNAMILFSPKVSWFEKFHFKVWRVRFPIKIFCNGHNLQFKNTFDSKGKERCS